MENRFIANDVAPEAIAALYKLSEFAHATSIPANGQQLINIRASQINGCAYCTNMHLQEARKAGETEVRLGMICVWREAGDLFSAEEQLLLGMTEEITLISKGGLSDNLYHRALEIYDEKKTVEIIMNIIAINSWNRLLASLRAKPAF